MSEIIYSAAHPLLSAQTQRGPKDAPEPFQELWHDLDF